MAPILRALCLTASTATAFLTSPLSRSAPVLRAVLPRALSLFATPQKEAVVSRSSHVKTSLTSAGALLGVAMFSSSSKRAAAADGAEGGAFVKTSSGLQYQIVKEGTGASPTPGQAVNVHYTGWLDGFDEAGRKFDSSYDRRRPFSFRAGAGQVISGWDEAVLAMKVGEVRNVIIPSDLGYGARGAGGVIPPNATLYFKIELLGIAG